MFSNREHAARQLAERLATLTLKDPIVLGIPRGGVVIGAVLAQALKADFDVALAHKLRAPGQSGFAIGALGEDGEPFLNEMAPEVRGVTSTYLAQERQHQNVELRRRLKLFRAVRPAADLAGRSVIVADEGIVTGSTMHAALRVLRRNRPLELIVAVPVASPGTLARLIRHCERIECLLAPRRLGEIAACYADFGPVDDEELLRLLRDTAPDWHQ